MLYCKALSSLQKVFLDEAPVADCFVGFSLFQKEFGAFQIALQSETPMDLTCVVNSDLQIESFVVECIPATKVCNKENSDDFYLRKTPGLYPDLLVPGASVHVDEFYRAMWFEIKASDYTPGKHIVEVMLLDLDRPVQTVTITVDILPMALPEQSLICTHWFHTDCLSTYYNVPVFSEDYWRITENFVRVAVAHGVNFLLTPLFTPPLDTAVGKERPTVQLVDVCREKGKYTFSFDKLHRWFEMCQRNGVRYFEMSHLFTQWGAKSAPKIMATVDGEYKKLFGWDTKATGRSYRKFLKCFSKALCAFLRQEGVEDRCFFHVSDEPSKRHLRRYKKHSRFIRKCFPGFPVLDALSDFAFYQKGCLERPIPCIDHAEEFVGHVGEMWTYICCGPGNGNYPNRFFSMPSVRTRILGFLMYKYEVRGFLQWGLNFWYSKLSDHPIDPFKISDADGAFPAGDAYVLYPGENGEPLVSLRFKVFREAIQDMQALKVLERLIGRERTMALLESDGKITFNTYPHEEAWLLSKREQIYSAVRAAMEYTEE